MTDTHTIDADLKQLIVRGLDTYYGSISATHGVETGNHYQSVALGDVLTRGFREDRSDFFDALDFENKKVLDLGSNLGELSRAARARGAYLVDGFESDSYFREVGDLINVLTDTTRVSFRGRSIADPSSYDERYDLVLAFSVFRYIRECLPNIADKTNILVLETHLLRGNFDSDYLEPVKRYFPFWKSLGESDWSRDHTGRTRAVIVFAKRKADLAAALKENIDEIRPSQVSAVPNVSGSVDDLAFDGRTLHLRGWCAASDETIDRIEVTTEASGVKPLPLGLLAVSSVTARADSDAIEFSVDCECRASGDEIIRFDVEALSHWIPVGRMHGYHLPGMFTNGEPPPQALAERLGETMETHKRALDSLKCLHDMLSPLGRYRALASFESVLDWGCRLGGLELFARHLLPEAEISAVDFDEAAVAWCAAAGLPGAFATISPMPPTELARGSFDLVLGHLTLARLTHQQRAAWLAEISRVMKAGGYAALTVPREPSIADETKGFSIAECAKWLDVLLYIEAGANNQQDLIVLRKG